MEIIDKRKGNWRVMVANTQCPFVFYPRCDIACEILEKENREDTYCTFENCPIKET